MKTIHIANDYSDTPLGRYPGDSEFNGERFREEFIRPALLSNERVAINLDGVEGCGSSFLDEAFGGLVRKGYFDAKKLREKLEIICDDAETTLYKDLIWKYIDEAVPQKYE